MNPTNQQYDKAVRSCREIFIQKTKDYGVSWRVLRTISLTDQIFIKAQRIRNIQQLMQKKVGDDITGEFKGMVNYGIIALILPVLLVRYWLRKRSLDPIAQSLYAAESRRAWRRPDTRAIVRLGGFLILSAVFLIALLTNKPPIAALSVGLSVLWLHRGWTIWRFAARWFDR